NNDPNIHSTAATGQLPYQPFDVRRLVEAGNDEEDFHLGGTTIIHGPPHDRDDAARTAVDGCRDVMVRSEASCATRARHSAGPIDHSSRPVAANAPDRPSYRIRSIVSNWRTSSSGSASGSVSPNPR